ncbi:TRAP-type C4-dicarboxylate transport system, substrate-binding protein [Malonomonas rubra DSM 5091]|uniref:TRAP-type C4-dicarboxylate transport system, substrate-binding protein n=1 Tax=Malonomonas rubra DSM 5091 TaxID=1122189 RepID=A0A1M6INU6_MALRU|nr:TRAP transporter substrate-binding protein [Malonomonas rubra]SHJ36125.1 TRAP-type C4-dicarboxylate transport system, substrate-binding protein [Malonomonas rubra DSM 5091]
MKCRVFACLLLCLLLPLSAFSADPLAAWQPKFDPSKAEYTYLLSTVAHPAIEGGTVGYRIRDRVWEESNGRLYVDYRPISQLGGEKDVLRKLQMGAIQGMLCSSVLAPNVSPRLGIVNLPFLIDSFAKLDQFRSNEELFREFGADADKKGIKVVDFTGYGSYGWATKTPVKSIDEAKQQLFRIAQAPVNVDLYKAWGFQFTVMPWADVPQALQTGVISALDHTPIVCNITKKFTVAKAYTSIDYAQGLYVHLMNKRWFNSLPEDLQQILLTAITEESVKVRALTEKQQLDQIAAAKANGIVFNQLPVEEKNKLVELAEPVVQKWAKEIGSDYLDKVRTALQ